MPGPRNRLSCHDSLPPRGAAVIRRFVRGSVMDFHGTIAWIVKGFAALIRMNKLDVSSHTPMVTAD
jgi:hypothetical protein